jgi:hypothetical protein
MFHIARAITETEPEGSEAHEYATNALKGIEKRFPAQRQLWINELAKDAAEAAPRQRRRQD